MVALFYVGATALGAAVAFVLAVGALRRRLRPAALQFALLNLDVAGWCATTVLLRLDVFDTKALWNLNNVFIFAFIFTWFAFVLAYTGRREWLWKPATMVLWAIPTAGAVVSFVAPARHFLVVGHTPETVVGLTVVPFTFTAVGATLLVGFFALDLLAFGLLVDFFRRSRSPYRRQIGAIIAGRVIALVTALVFYLGLSHHELSFIPVAYAVQSVVIGWALFRYDLLDSSPLVADTIVTQMTDAVVVVDATGSVVDCNPAFVRLVGARSARQLVDRLRTSYRG